MTIGRRSQNDVLIDFNSFFIATTIALRKKKERGFKIKKPFVRVQNEKLLQKKR